MELKDMISIDEIREYFDVKDFDQSRDYSIDRNEGTIDFAERVYDNGRMSLINEGDYEKYLRFTKIAMENVMEFLSVRLPRIDASERGECLEKISQFLIWMSKEFHFFIFSLYENWANEHNYVFRNFMEIRNKGVKAIYPEEKDFRWDAKKVIDSISPNGDIGRYPKMYFEFLFQKDPSKKEPVFSEAKNITILKNMFPTAGLFQGGLKEEAINLPIFEDMMSIDDFGLLDIYPWMFDNYLTKRPNKDTDERIILVPSYARCVPDTSLDTFGQSGDYDLTVNYGNNVFRYSAMIRWTRSWITHNINDIANTISCGIPSFNDAIIFPVPYPEILDVDQFLHNIPNTIRYIQNEKSPIPGDKVINSLLKTVREKGYTSQRQEEEYWTGFFNHYKNDEVNVGKGILLETPGVSYRFLFHPLQNTLNKKIRTFFISIYRLGDESDYILNLLRGLVRNGVYVYAYVEPMARGDEKQNQRIIKELKDYGIHVCHKCKNLKVHMKAWLAIYEDNSMLGMIGTGNFNITTMRNYTDLHYITKDETICKELLIVFKTLFSGGDFKSNYEYFMNPNRRIFITPISGRRVIYNSMRHLKIRDDIFIKCNNFTDKECMNSIIYQNPIYKNLRMMIRTSVTTWPNNSLDIRSKVSDKLEHSRIYVFGEEVMISSADLMKRNLDRRLEIFLRIPESASQLVVYTSDTVTTDGGMLLTSIPFNEYISNLWNSCNYKLDPLTLKWKVRVK